MAGTSPKIIPATVRTGIVGIQVTLLSASKRIVMAADK